MKNIGDCTVKELVEELYKRDEVAGVRVITKDDIIRDNVDSGYVNNPKLFRRWIMAQIKEFEDMFTDKHGMNQKDIDDFECPGEIVSDDLMDRE